MYTARSSARRLDDQTATERVNIRWGRITLLIAGIVALYVLGQYVTDMVTDQLGLHVRARNEPLLHKTIMTAMVIYIVLMTIPFMPAVEIGLSLLLIFGAKIAFLVYVSTLIALTLAYFIGRLLPAELAARAFAVVGLKRAQEFMNRLAPLSAQERMAVIMRESPTRLTPYLIRHRFLSLAVLLNLPGNVAIGGGGGIVLLAGMTRLFPFPAYLLTVALAVAPVPLIVSFWAN